MNWAHWYLTGGVFTLIVVLLLFWRNPIRWHVLGFWDKWIGLPAILILYPFFWYFAIEIMIRKWRSRNER